jgi:hypothetical protein
MDTKISPMEIETTLDTTLEVSAKVSHHVHRGSSVSFELAMAMQSFSPENQHKVEQFMNQLYTSQSTEERCKQIERWNLARKSITCFQLSWASSRVFKTIQSAATQLFNKLLLYQFFQLWNDTQIFGIEENTIIYKPYCPRATFRIPWGCPPEKVQDFKITGDRVQYRIVDETTYVHDGPDMADSIRKFLHFEGDKILTADEIRQLIGPIIMVKDLTKQHCMAFIQMVTKDKFLRIRVEPRVGPKVKPHVEQRFFCIKLIRLYL